MTNPVNSKAGQPPDAAMLVDVGKLISAYYHERPDPGLAAEHVVFGTSGHRGSAFDRTFNEWHILAISQAVCDFRRSERIDGPLFIGIDTHALSGPAYGSAMEVLAANGVEVMTAGADEYTPTPAISHAILTYNRDRPTGLADGIVITPSHNPPEEGGFKYNPPHGGPAQSSVTSWIEKRANEFLSRQLDGVRRVSVDQARRASTTHLHDFRSAYVGDLGNALDMDVIRRSGLKLGVDPLGGAGVRYWTPIAERYGLDLSLTSDRVDPTFRFMTVDWDGRIRMDPSSPYAMQRLVDLQDRFDIAFACDADHDRHGIVTRSAGLLPPNHYLSVAVHYLLSNRPLWATSTRIGKTVVTSSFIDRVAASAGRGVYEVPVGFKWFVDGLLDGSLCFGGEESAGAAFARLDGRVWTTDKDGIEAALLAAEITARSGHDPGEIYRSLTANLGEPVYERLDVPAAPGQKPVIASLSEKDVDAATLAGEPVRQILTVAPGDRERIGGLKVVAESGWFAVRPSGTEDILKIYAESFRGDAHLRQIQEEAQAILASALRHASIAPPPSRDSR